MPASTHSPTEKRTSRLPLVLCAVLAGSFLTGAV